MLRKSTIVKLNIAYIILSVLSIILIFFGGLLDTGGMIWYGFGFILIAIPGYILSLIAFLLLLILVNLFLKFKSKVAKLDKTFQTKRILIFAIFSIFFFLIGFGLAFAGNMLQGFTHIDRMQFWFVALMLPGYLVLGISLVFALLFTSRFVNLIEIVYSEFQFHFKQS